MDLEWFDAQTFVLVTTSAIGSLVYYISTWKNAAIQNLENVPNVEVGAPLKRALNDETFLPYIAIRGGTKELTSKIIKSETGHEGVIQMILINEHSMRRYGSGFWGGAVREIGTTLNDVPFGLKSLSHTSPIVVEIVDPLQAMHENLLSTVSTKFTPATPGFASTVMGYFMGNASTGIETMEKLLSLDTNVTAVGQLSVTSGKYRLSMPLDRDTFPFIISTLPLERLVEDFKSVRKGQRIVAYIFFAIATAVAANKGWKLWKAFELKQMRRRILRDRAERADRSVEPNANSTTATNDLNFCVVCLTNPREVILVPCGHVVVCVDCMERLNNSCPVCRRHFTRSYAAYIS